MAACALGLKILFATWARAACHPVAIVLLAHSYSFENPEIQLQFENNKTYSSHGPSSLNLVNAANRHTSLRSAPESFFEICPSFSKSMSFDVCSFFNIARRIEERAFSF